jgi:hypothetical protein
MEVLGSMQGTKSGVQSGEFHVAKEHPILDPASGAGVILKILLAYRYTT